MSICSHFLYLYHVYKKLFFQRRLLQSKHDHDHPTLLIQLFKPMSWKINEILSVSASQVKFLGTAWIILAPSLWSEKIRMDDLRATVPYVFNSCNIRRTKNCASFGLINFISEHILYLIPKKTTPRTVDQISSLYTLYYSHLIFHSFKHYHQLSKVKWQFIMYICKKKKMATLDLHVNLTNYIFQGR